MGPNLTCSLIKARLLPKDYFGMRDELTAKPYREVRFALSPGVRLGAQGMFEMHQAGTL